MSYDSGSLIIECRLLMGDGTSVRLSVDVDDIINYKLRLPSPTIWSLQEFTVRAHKEAWNTIYEGLFKWPDGVITFEKLDRSKPIENGV